MNKGVKISMVSYINAKPFQFGMESAGIMQDIELHLEVPSLTALKLQSKSVDIALVPIAVLPKLSAVEIITDYCIGANKKVDSVLLLSQVPLDEINQVYLDSHSRTSANLIQVLFRQHWNKEVEYIPNHDVTTELIKGDAACLMIGDKALKAKNRFAYEYDLAEEWYKMTGLPFVFAVWVANKKGKYIEDQLNHSFAIGLENIKEVATLYQSQYPEVDLVNYLTKAIDFKYDAKKAKALDLFLNYCKNNELSLC